MSKPQSPPPSAPPRGILVSASNNPTKAHGGDARPETPIPTAILVADMKVREANRPALGRKLSTKNQLPWVPIIAGGSALWTVVIVGLALYAMATEREQARLQQPEVKLLAVVAPGQAQVKPARVVAPNVVEPIEDVEVKVNAPAPKLPFREPAVAKVGDMPPPIQIVPDALKRLPAEGPVDGFQPANKVCDVNAFADCASVGTTMKLHRDPVEAFERARAEKKMVFMVHLSGDLEDKDFT